LNRYFLVGLIFTLTYLTGAGWYVGYGQQSISTLELNALGDFLAGVFSPLAFLWLVLGFLQQGEELRQNGEALRLQAEELRKSVEHQEQLVLATREQVEFEKSVVERQAQQLANKERPIFYITGGSNSGSSHTNGRTFAYQIQNIGERAADLYLEVERGVVAGLTSRRPMLERGDEMRIQLHTYAESPDESFSPSYSRGWLRRVGGSGISL
jgi:hypothetical protein